MRWTVVGWSGSRWDDKLTCRWRGLCVQIRAVQSTIHLPCVRDSTSYRALPFSPDVSASSLAASRNNDQINPACSRPCSGVGFLLSLRALSRSQALFALVSPPGPSLKSCPGHAMCDVRLAICGWSGWWRLGGVERPSSGSSRALTASPVRRY